MTRWHRDEVESSWLRHTTEDTKSDDKGMEGGEGRGSRPDTAVDECRSERVDVWQGTGSTHKWILSCYSSRVQAAFFVFVDLFAGGGGSTTQQ